VFWEIFLILLAVLIFIWLTISFIAVILTMIGPPDDLHDVPIAERDEKK